MDKKLSKYFCIFCSNSSNISTITEAYNHYKQHMKSNYYCLNCDNNMNCDQKHNQSSDGSEESLIEMWIERFLSYQNELIDKSFRDLLNSSKLFTGCPVCESFLRLCNNNNIEIDVQSIRWSNNQSVANECRHASSHLRYYPFECLKCEKVGRYHKKCDMNEISRHIKDNHSINLKNSNFEGLVKSVKIAKLESFIEFGFKNKNRFNFINNKNLSSNSKVSKTIRTDNKTKANVIEVVSEPKPKKPKIETQIIVANNNQRNDCNLRAEDNKKTTICSNNKSIILSINKKPNNVINEKKVVENLDQKSPKLKFTPIIKTYSNSIINNKIKPKQNNLISGQQIIIKRQTNDCATVEIKSSTKPVTETKNYLSQEFKDMMEDEEIDFIPNTCTQLTNIVYFCIFCSEKFTSKESAYHHFQNHVDYYPIMCLTCGEGLTDLQSFLIHHRETHPEAVKGRYKKKEQPVIDKWISSFLYSQTTITNAFPPRDQCPVCDRVFTRQEIESSRPRRCTINRRIDHLHRHMCYLPYECLKCKESGTEFFVAYFESKAHSHIKQKHPEIDDNESRWHIFQKTITIPKLDEFIENYLSQFGISMQFERRPVKKAKQFSSPEEFNNKNNFGLIDLNNSSLNLNMVFSDLIDSSNVLELNKDKLNIKSHNNKDIDLIVIDDNNDIAIDECVNNNNSNDSDIVVNVSPHSLFDKSVTFNAEEDSYFCIFCPTVKYFSKTDAYSHYGEHLDYLPVLCKICGFKFSNVDHLMTHHQSMHSTQTNVDYQICEDQILMKWVNEFLESQFDYQKAIKKVMPCSCSYNCPVCVKLINNQLSTSLIPCTQHNDVSFSVHIHQHLVYFPYECITCKRNGKTVRVPNLDSMAMNHLKEHKIESSSMYQLCKNFPKTLVIPKLEKMIGDSVHSKRMSEKKNKLDTSLIMPQIPQQSSSSFAVMESDSSSEQSKAHSPQPVHYV